MVAPPPFKAAKVRLYWEAGQFSLIILLLKMNTEESEKGFRRKFSQMKYLYALLTVLLFCLFAPLHAQILTPGSELGHSFMYDEAAFMPLLENAPAEGDPMMPTRVPLLSPIGDSIEVVVWESDVLSPDLKAAYPEVRTFILGNAETGQSVGRMVVSPRGLDVVLRTETGMVVIEPDEPQTPMHTSYFTRFAPFPTEGDEVFEPEGYVPHDHASRNSLSFGSELLSYRLAIIADGEYSQQRGGNSPSEASVLAALAADVSALNVIYERDLAIRLILTEAQIYLNPGSDIFPNAASAPASEAVVAFGELIDQGVLQTGDFDIGHVFSGRGGGSSAYVQAVCRNFSIDVTGDNNGDGPLKGGAGSRSNGLQGAGWIGLVAHEMGHQFGARHTFNGNSNNCSGGNYNESTAYEIGSGSTIMSYGGICGNDNLSGGRDLYFHINSIEAIYTYTREGNGSACPIISSIANTPPVVNANPENRSYTIPKGTPFVLSGQGSDSNGGQTLTYTWEQYDLGRQGDPSDAAFDTGNTGENGAPLFRSFEPTLSPERSFPSTNEIVGVNDLLGEILPLVGRDMDFRLTVRDNNSGGGGVACDEITVSVDDSSGPFEVIDPDAFAVWQAGSTETIQWSVAGTDGAPINCQNVQISLSTDGGQSFPFVLAASTPNDGSHDFTVPSISAAAARIKIAAVDNIFFDITSEPVTISSDCLAEAALLQGDLLVEAEAGSALLDIDLAPNYGELTNSLSATIDSNDPMVNLHVETTSGCNSYGNAPRYEIRRFQVSQTGNYTFDIDRNFSAITNIHLRTFDPDAPCATLLASSGQLGGGNTVNISNFVIANLMADQEYIILFSGFNSGDSGEISVDITGPAGSQVTTGIAEPGSGFAYRYVVADDSDNILAFQADADLSNDAQFPEGDYSIFGLSVANGDVSSLNAFVGQQLNTLNSAILNGTICADLSTNNATVIINGAVLPVELLAFAAENERQRVRLWWETSIEENNDYYRLERSADGRRFEPLAKIDGQGSTAESTFYQYYDEDPLNGRSYYRLIQVDFDGTTTNLGIREVLRSEKKESVEVFPNPVAGQLVNIRWSSGVELDRVILIAADGRVMQTSQPLFNQQTLEWNLPDLPSGLYVLRLFFNDGEQQQLQLVKA